MKIFRALLLLAISAALFAQADRGSISGTITDSTGAAVPGVALTLKNQATNLTYSTTASASGAYSFLNLPIGMYILTAAAKGFERSEARGIQVQVNQQSRIDIALQIGELTQTVEVQAGAAMIQTESTDVGTVVSADRSPLMTETFLYIPALGSGPNKSRMRLTHSIPR
jgi:hypothetical protein